MVAECSKILIQVKTRRSLSRTPSGKSEGAGWGEESGVTNPAAPGAAPTLAPSRKPPAAQEVVWRTASRTVRGGRDFRPGDDPALGLQRLSGSQGRQAVPLAVRVL